MAKMGKLWLFTRNNVRRRYVTTRAGLRKKGYTYDRSRRAWRIRRAPHPPPPPPKGKLFRQTLAINYVVRNTYYSVVLQAWSKSEKALRDSEGAHKEELVRELERIVGWRRENWWFVHQIGIGYQMVPYDKFLDGRKEIRNERRGG